jgi:hypothetical protein
MVSWSNYWGNREEQFPQKEIMCGKSIIAIRGILNTWSDTEVEAQVGEVDIGILEKIK